MRPRSISTTAFSSLALLGSLTLGSTVATNAQAATSASSCASITKSLMIADGFSGATTPKVTPYNYTKPSMNPANALGTTIDFGPKALVVACVSPSDIKKLSAIAQGSSKSPMSATQYLAYVAKGSAGAMKKTSVGGVSDYLDFGNGKEDGLGSTSKAGGVRLDAWATNKYIFLTFSAPVSMTAPKALLSFIKTTGQLF